MNNYDKLLMSILSNAQKPGRVMAPIALLKAVRRKKYPFRALNDIDKGNALFKTFEDEFAFIKYAKVAGRLRSDQDYENWVALIRWIIAELKKWRITNDRKFHMLITILIVTHSCDLNGAFWITFPDVLGDNLNLIKALHKVIANSRVEFLSRKNVVQVWETEALSRFKLADAKGDLVKIAENWRILDHAALPNFFQTQAVRILYRFAFKHLVLAVKRLRQVAVTTQVAHALSAEQSMVLANASDNPYVNFSCIFTMLTERSRRIELSHREQELMTELLVKISKDSAKWKEWMRIFNHYPMRYPDLQVALGNALAVVPITAVEAYVSSIVLTVSPDDDPNMACVAVCLSSFRKAAAPKQRHKLWVFAYRRWSEWQFDIKNNETLLFKISCTALDYAVVGYAIECMDNTGRDQILTEIRESLSSLDKRWYLSISSCITEYNRLLSMFQPYAYAKSVIGKDWLIGTTIYQPFNETYLSMMFSI